jgi:flagellar basal-body rod protein FlgF
VAVTDLYVSMAGLETTTAKLATVAQNLANVNTQGYAAAQTAAMALPFQGAAPAPGADVIPVDESVDTTDGTFGRTDNPFNLAVKGGWFVVQAGGQEALTRSGVFAQSAGGLLTTQTGEPVLGVDGAPISLPMLQRLGIAPDGTISGIPAGSESQQPQVFGQLLIAASPPNGQLKPLGNSIYSIADGSAPVPATDAVVQQGYLEGSNVNSVASMISMIDATKSFQLQTQVVEESTKSATSLDQILAGS